MVTIKEVAEKAGVSIATVSRVVHNKGKVGEERRRHVQKVIQALGYKPNFHAQALANKTNTSIGLVTPKLSMTFFGCLAAGAEDAARENNFQLFTCNSLYETKSELDAIHTLRRNNCSAIVLHSEYSDEELLVDLTHKIPGLVLINRYIETIKERCIWLDNIGGGKAITEHLLESGHCQIAAITSVYQNNDPDLRLEGMRLAMAEQNLTLDEELIVRGTANIRGGAEAAQALMQKNKSFSAVFAYNDLMAIGAMNAFQDAGLRVPEDISVVGFDDSPVSQACRPSLTTMRYPIEEMAHYAANLAIQLSQDQAPSAPEKNLFQAKLIKRRSSRPRGIEPAPAAQADYF